MSGYKIEQHRLTHRGRGFHFVSYDGTPANPARDVRAGEPTWYMMSAGKRWAVMPHRVGQDPVEVGRLFVEWLDRNVFA